LDVSVENEPHHLALAVHHGAARIPADDIRRTDEVEWHPGVQLPLPVLPTLRQAKRLALTVLLSAGEGATERGERRHTGVVLLVALHSAEGQPEGESSVGVLVLTAQGEDRVTDLAIGLLLRLLDLLLVSLTGFTGRPVHEAGQPDQRIARRLDALLARP